MKKVILLSALLLLFAFKCFGQSDFRKGFVITSNYDTLYGFVNYKESLRANKVCNFKKLLDQPVVTYEPNQLVGYGFENDKFFVSREIRFKEVKSRVFLEVLVGGIVNLFEYDQKYWVEKDTSGILPLTNETTEIYLEGRRVFRNSNQHIATLNILLFDCAEVRTKLQKIEITERSLTDLIKAYNICKGASLKIYKEKKPWIRTGFGIAGGLTLSKIDFVAQVSGYDHLLGKFESTGSPTMGVTLDIQSPRISERFSFTGNVLYTPTSFYRFFENSSPTTRNYITIKLHQVELPIGFRYTFPAKNITPFLNLGVVNTQHIKFNSIWTQEVLVNGVVITNEGEALIIKKWQLGFWGGIGATKTLTPKLNASFELRYTMTNGISPFYVGSGELRSGISTFQFLLAIKKK